MLYRWSFFEEILLVLKEVVGSLLRSLTSVQKKERILKKQKSCFWADFNDCG